ncbi:HNH endonuclease [Nocardioides flavus (ex Wang et al. 2016)]|uniref:HNH endonuclease n=1 Tax=Nocardioides flavus (ex Wang et al. 2016) TaxID=2058780 RepID=A0ABQ3HJ44_9ACTN|nr:DUF222 domain-containing protein [Nocardioides flavus (ex Wang et al. 2016)]GHE16945.1 HNH endonuclease [Nocardioides flavus (ex Wang et al. 2016)]
MTSSQPPLTAAAVTAMRREVQVSLDGPSGLDDAGRVDLVRALEELVCTATAAQAAVAAELATSVEADHEALGLPAASRGQGVASMVAHARRESPHRGQRHLGLARIVQRELPHTWAAWRSGRVSEWRATLIARETACLSLEHRLGVDEALAADAGALEAMSDRQVVAAAQVEATRLDAAAQVARRRKAEAERRVSIRPAPDTMVWLTTLLPAGEGVATYAALAREADRARAQGDPRTRGQVMADALVQSVLDDVDSEPEEGSRSHRSLPVALGVVMSDAALFGGADDTAHLEGFGPIPAELAREIVCGALSADEQLSIRRLYASPESGELVAMDARTRTFRGNLARFIRLRDQVCRTPWCDAPIRHTDHVEPYEADGPTTAANGQGLCEACNHAKQSPRWRARPGPGGSVTTTTPTGHTRTSRPPPIATIRWRDAPALTIDYVLAG